MSRRTALVTGASAGLGQVFARELARDGMNLVLSARRSERLDGLKRDLEADRGINVLCVPADLADPAAPTRIYEAVTGQGIEVDMLVNNAGYGVAGHFLASPWEVHQRFMEVMIGAVLRMTHLFLPGMVKRGHGRIINVASLAALVPSPAGHTLYGAAKAFLVKMSEALSLEMAGKGVHVTVTCPGFTHTEFHDVLGNRDLVSRLPSYMWMEADEVVRGAIGAVTRGQLLHVPGAFNQATAVAAKALPTRALRWLAARHGARIRKQTPSAPSSRS